MWEKDINIHEVREIRSRTTVFFGVGAIAKIDDICKDLKARGLDKLIVVTGHGAYKKTGAWDYVTKAFAAHGITYVHYDKVTPNPNTHHVNEAAKMAQDFGAKAMLAIGGGRHKGRVVNGIERIEAIVRDGRFEVLFFNAYHRKAVRFRAGPVR